MTPTSTAKTPLRQGDAHASVALVGTPNCGKTTLFNALTGLRQKVANYPGVTVEKKDGWLDGTGGSGIRIMDLPGIYSLEAQTPEETVASDILRGKGRYDEPPTAVLAVLDGSALERSLALLGSLLALRRPVAAVVTMVDEVKARGGALDPVLLSRELGIPVAAVVGHRGIGIDDARRLLDAPSAWPIPENVPQGDAAQRYAWATDLLTRIRAKKLTEDSATRRIDRWVLHPVAGPVLFLAVMAFFFQSIFTWAQPAMEGLEKVVGALGAAVGAALPEGALRGFIVNGIIDGVGGVLVFLPQILVLFFLLFLMEDIGYMARAAFLMDRVMGLAGLQGRSFVALLSSYACAVPGIMATRGIPSPQDRLATMLVAPVVTCSARLPVYALLIGAFIPDQPVFGPLRSQGLALLSLYVVGSVSAFLGAWVLRASVLKGDITPFFIELPPYRFPTFRTVFMAMFERAKLFVRRAGTIILGASLGIWLLLHFPAAPAGDSGAQLRHSAAGRIGRVLEPVFAPLGFDWRINVALVSSLVAREVAVSTMAQIYAVETEESDASLRQALRDGKDPATGKPFLPAPAALALIAFFVYALQCTSTLAVLRRETGSWKWPAAAFTVMFVAAWLAGFCAYRVGTALGL